MSGSNIFNTGAVLAAPAGALLMPDYEVAIGADPTTVEWWHPDTDAITESAGAVSQLRSQKATGGTVLNQATAASQPTLLSAAINGRNALRFAKQTVGAPDRFLYTFPAGASLSWTKIMVVRDFSELSGNLWSASDGNGHRLEFAYSVNDLNHVLARMGAANVLTSFFKPRPLNTWFLVMSSFDHVAGQSALSVNGGGWALSSATGGSVTGTASGIGAFPADGSNAGGTFDAAMIALDSTALHLAGNATKLGLWKQLIRDDFGLTIA